VDRETEAKRECSVRATAAVRCRPAGARVEGGNGVASAGRARSEGARVGLELGATRGGEMQQEVARGGRKQRWQCCSRGAKQGGHQRKKKGGMNPGTGLQNTKILGAYQ
jgi:hypothetical protein